MTGTVRRSPLRVAVAGSAVGKALEALTLVLLATVVPRALGPGDFGEFSLALTLVTLGSLVLTLGGPTLMSRVVPGAPPEQRVALARAIGARLARGRALQVVVIAFVALVVALWRPALVGPLDTTLVLAAFALNVATSLALQVALGLGSTVPWSLRFPLQNAVLVIAVLVLHPLAGVTGSIIAILCSAVVGAAFAAVVAVRVAGGDHPRVEVPPGTIRFGVLLASGAALVQFSQRGGVIGVALLSGSSVEVGYAALAIGIALGITFAVLQCFTVALPHLVDHTGRARSSAAAEVTLRRMATYALAVILPIALVVAATLDTVVPLVFGDEYSGATTAFGPALALVVLAPMGALLTQAAALRDRAGAALAVGIAGAVVFLAGALVTIPVWAAAGATGAALGGGVAGAATGTRQLPGAAGRSITCVTFAGTALVLALALVLT